MTEVRAIPEASVTALAMFEWRVAHDPEADLILTPDGVGRSYGELAGRVGLLAKALEGSGVQRGDVVGLYLANEPAWIVALLACWRAGAVAACCGSLSPVAEASRRFDTARAVHVIARDQASPDWTVTVIDAEGELAVPVAQGDADVLAPKADLLRIEDPGVVLFTSGTTGEPKAIWRRHAELAEAPRVTAGAYAKTAGFRARTAPPTLPPALSFSPFGHASALGRLIFRLYVGRQLLIIPKFDVDAIAQIAARYPVDTLHLTPAMIHELAFTEREIAFNALKYINSGSAPLPISTRDRFEARYGVPVLQAYGSTEGTITALEHYDDVIAGRRGPGSVGRIPDGMAHRIVDADGKDVAPGEQGELLGRWRAAEGAEPNPAVDAEGWFHTGDLARIDEHGILYICGRIKEMMIVGGFNVYPGEVEEALRKAPQIREAVVVALPDARLGEIPVVGIVWEAGVAEADMDNTWRQIASEARRSIEAYKLPRRWFQLTDIPRNANDKVDRAAAAALAREALGLVAE
jgi:acyl-CoA synthetase (AMP-forming)/AMP-acid ligase II